MSPFALDRPFGYTEFLRHFIDRHSCKEAHFHDPALPWIELFELLNRFIECHELKRRSRKGMGPIIQLNFLPASSSLLAPLSPCVIDQDPSHGLRRHSKEVGTSLPVDPGLIDQTDKRFMDQCGRFQGVINSL